MKTAHAALKSQTSSQGSFGRRGAAIILGGAVLFVVVVVMALAILIPRMMPPQPSDEPFVNNTPPPGPAPEGMVWIPGGQFRMGDNDPRMPDAKPLHVVSLDGFW